MGFILSRLSVSMMGLSPRRLAPSQPAATGSGAAGEAPGFEASLVGRCNQSRLWYAGVIGI